MDKRDFPTISRKKVRFIVASDEEQNPEDYQSFNYTFATGEKVGSGHYFENILELSRCDYIASVPSTFTAIAGFLGNTPILPLTDAKVALSLDHLMYDHIFDAIRHPDFSVSVK